MLKKRLGIIATVLVGLSLPACGGGGNGAAGTSGGKTPYIALYPRVSRSNLAGGQNGRRE